MSCPSKKTSNRSLVYGDFDKDGTPNIDDKYPYDKNRKAQKDELQLTNELRIINRRRNEHRQLLNNTMADLKRNGYPVKGRIKSTTSVVNKLRRKYLYSIKDMGGILIFVNNQEEAENVVDYLQSRYNVVEVENFYRTAHRTGNYKAIHVLIEKGGNYLEVQLKTNEDYKKAQAGHKQYKLSDVRK